MKSDRFHFNLDDWKREELKVLAEIRGYEIENYLEVNHDF